MRTAGLQPTSNERLRGARRFVPAAAWMGLIFLLSARETVPKPPGFDASLTSVLGHFGVYAVLAAFTWWALGAFSITTRQRTALAFGLALLYGISDEWHQSFVPGRQPDAFDVLVDGIGAAAGIACATWIASRLDRRNA
jgi:VanZ family protein